MTEKRFEVYDDGFSKHIEDTYYTEDKHEHNLYDIWEMCRKLNELYEENEQLKAQLYCDSNEGVCSICKHHYLEKGNIFYISKCEKGHEKCSKESVRHCEDFEVKELEND